MTVEDMAAHLLESKLDKTAAHRLYAFYEKFQVVKPNESYPFH